MLSIITPVLNGAPFIEENIKIISKLSVPFEHIIVDGGSIDETVKIIKKYSHIKLLQQTEKTGMYGGLHLGFLEADGNYLAYVNADDRIIPEGFEIMYNYISNGKADVVYSDAILEYSDARRSSVFRGNRFGKFFLRKGVLPFVQPSAIFTKGIYNKTGGVDYEHFRICGDLDLFFRFANHHGSRFKYIRKFSSVFLVRENSLGNRNSKLVDMEKTINNLPIPNSFNRILFKVTKI